MKTIMVFGSFDVIHPGHLYYLCKAKSLGDKLIVVVGRNKTIKKIKGKAPLYDENDRVKCVNALKMVDIAVLGYGDDQYRVLEEYRPDIICLGYDQKSFITAELMNEIKKRGLNIKVVRIKPYKKEVFKSSKLKNENYNAHRYG